MPNWNHIVREHLAVLRLPPEREIEIVEELALHLEAAYEKALADGFSESEAEARAAQSYDWRLLECELSLAERPVAARAWRPSLDLIERKGGIRMGSFIQDLRFGARMLLKNPGFTLIAVLTLALGIGANTAIFSVVNGVLLKPLPYDQPGQLVQLWEDPGGGTRKNRIAPGAFLDWREHNTTFESLSVFGGATLNLAGAGEPERLNGVEMSAGGLETLRARPLLGRTFAPDEDQPGKDKVVVLTYRLWQRRWSGDAAIIGRTVQFGGLSYTVIGVLPPNFLPWETAEFVIPYVFSPQAAQQRGMHFLRAFARLKPGVSVEQAQVELNAIAQRLKPLYPASKKDWGVTVVPLHEEITSQIKPTLLLLLGAVALVLLIACANVANLLLARASARQRELTIRAALGAGRWRIVRQLLTESVLLALLGALCGLLLAYWSVDALTRLIAVNLPRAQEIGLDMRVLGFTLLVSLVTGLAFGLAPAYQAARLNLNDTLKESGRSLLSNARNRLRGGLVAAEVALALMLLVGAGLLLKSFVRLSNVSPGFNPQNALTMQITLPEKKYPDAARRSAFFMQALQRIEALPGVEAAGLTWTLPVIGGPPSTGFKIEGRKSAPEGGDADFDYCTPNFFRALGIPLLKGRVFEASDTAESPRVVIVNETLARAYFPNEEPLGQRLRIEKESWEIVGVVGDWRSRGLAEKVNPRYYLPQPFSKWGSGSLIVRTAGAPLALAEGVRKAILTVDAEQPVANLRTLEDVIATSVAQRRLTLRLIGLFAVLALLLAAIGLYGVMGYVVTLRTNEIGIRLALGAQTRDVLRMVILQGMTLVGIGLFIGLIGAFSLTRFIAAQLYEMSAVDPATFALVSLLLTGVALLACYIPARRATKVDPLTALRHE
jgi:putative ABC transport system permease protein